MHGRPAFAIFFTVRHVARRFCHGRMLARLRTGYAKSPLPDRLRGNWSKPGGGARRRLEKGQRRNDWQTSRNVIKTLCNATTLSVVCSESSGEA